MMTPVPCSSQCGERAILKKVFVKAPTRVQLFREKLPNIPLPPEPVLTLRTWLKAVEYYSDHLDEVAGIISSLEDETTCISCAKDLLKDDSIHIEVAYIRSHITFLVAVIASLETSGKPIYEQLDYLAHIREKHSSAPGPVGEKRPKTGDALCKECFFFAFETEIHNTIVKGDLFKPGQVVAVAASGGKDSTVLAYVLKLLNKRHSYGLNLVLLSVDEGITGYRDDSLETVKQNRDDYEMPLKILSYQELYGWTMDAIVEQIGRKSNCTFCGVFRRQALDRGAALLKVDCVATGHNADDLAETILMNVLRGDIARLKRCTAMVTASEGTIPRCKPLKYTYEKEIVMYAYYKRLYYFSTECVFAPNAYRGYARAFLKDLEKIRPTAVMDIIHSGERLSVREGVRLPQVGICTRCGFVSSQPVCKACVLLDGLNRGLPRLGIGKSSKVNRSLVEEEKRKAKAKTVIDF